MPDPREPERAVVEPLGRPVALDHRRRVRLDDERRAGHATPYGERIALDERNLAPAVEPGIHRDFRAGRRRDGNGGCLALARDDGLDPERRDLRDVLRRCEAEATRELGAKLPGHVRKRPVRDLESGLRARRADFE